MPEGDSVYRLARRLDAALTGRRVLTSDFRVPRFATSDVSGSVVTGTVSCGKHLLTRLDSGLTLHTAPRMDGAWSLLHPGRRLPRRVEPDVRLLLRLDDASTAAALRMPVVELVSTREEQTVVGHLGPDLLDPACDVAEAARRLAADPSRAVVEALLDQRNAAGLGNVWAVELCFLRGISPWTPVGETDAAALVALGRRLLASGVRHPGMVTTGDPRPGQAHWVYGRAGRACRRCGARVRLRPATGAPYARETWWCPSCQPGPGPGPVRVPGLGRPAGAPASAAGGPGSA